MLLSEIKKKASYYIQDKYKSARLALTDVTEAEILAEEATNSDPWGPDAKLMTKISEAAHDMDDYRRIVDVLHKRFYTMDWKEWRQAYKTLIVLEFLLTHGPEGMFEEFHCDLNTIHDLEDFTYVDEKGFDWGACMRSKSKCILKLLSDKDQLKEAREKALRISREIQGFGNQAVVSPISSCSSRTSRSSFGSYSSVDSPTNLGGLDESFIQEEHYVDYYSSDAISNNLHKRSPRSNSSTSTDHKEVVLEGIHLWDSPIDEDSILIESKRSDQEKEGFAGWSPRFYSRIFGTTAHQTKRDHKFTLKTLSDHLNQITPKKKMERQSSLVNFR